MPFLQIGGRRTFYNQVTPEGGQPGLHFIFIHGLGSSHAFWEPIQKHLAQSGHSSVAFDTQGSAFPISDVASLSLKLRLLQQEVVSQKLARKSQCLSSR